MIGVSWQDHSTNDQVRNKSKVRDIMHVIKAENELVSVMQLAFKTIDGHPKYQTGDPWMLANQEVDMQRDDEIDDF